MYIEQNRFTCTMGVYWDTDSWRQWCWMRVVSWLGEVRIPMKHAEAEMHHAGLVCFCYPRGSMLWPAMRSSVQPGTETSTPSGPLPSPSLEWTRRNIPRNVDVVWSLVWKHLEKQTNYIMIRDCSLMCFLLLVINIVSKCFLFQNKRTPFFL